MSRVSNISYPESQPIKSIVIETLSAAEIVSNSAVSVKDTRNSVSSSLHNTNTLEDERMFPVRSKECQTCGKFHRHHDRSMECPGHWGHIKLNYPIPCPVFETAILNILRCVCVECSRLRTSADSECLDLLKLPKNDRMNWLKDRVRTYKVCVFCDARLPDKITFRLPEVPKNRTVKQYSIPSQSGILASSFAFYELKYPKWGEYTKEHIRHLTTRELHVILSRISPEALQHMGIKETNRPENMVLMSIPVIPPNCRLPHKSPGRDQVTNPMSSCYNSIISKNKDMEVLLTEGIARYNNNQTNSRRSQSAAEILESIYLSTAAIMCERKSDAPASKRSVVSIGAALGEKKGLVKGDCITKRTDNSARSVITAGPDLDIDEIGIPQCIAENTFLVEHVFAANKEHIESLVRQGKVNLIFPTNGSPYSPKMRKDWRIEPGYRVRRQILDGDYCIVLRNPILMLGSMLGVRVKITLGINIQLPLAITTPMGADYDGRQY